MFVGTDVMTARILALIAFLLLLSVACDEPSKRDRSEDNILRETQELFDSVAPGNKAPWMEYMADDVMYFDEQGHNMDKKALLATIEPLPSGMSGTIKILNSRMNVQGNTVIHSYDMDESENVHGQRLHARYHATDTWMNRDRKWQIIAGQALQYYEDPAPGITDLRKFHDYVGTYDLAGQREIVSDGKGKLYLTRRTAPRIELIPEACDVFFRKGVEGRQIFHYAEGKVDSLIDRRNNEDIVWKRVH